MTIENNNINTGDFDKKKLLDELAHDISNKFGIKKEEAKKLIKSETLLSLDSLKNKLNKDIENSDIKNVLKNSNIKNLLENSSKIEIKTLKEDIEKNINIEEFKNHIEDYLPPKLISKAKNPQKPHEHILGFALGTTNSIISTINILYKIGKGILQSPYHLYMIIVGKAKTNSFKNI